MRIITEEIKKILKPSVLIVYAAIYIFMLFVVPGPMSSWLDTYKMWNGESLPIDGIIVSDTLLERYGTEISGSEIDDFEIFCKEYEENLNKAVAENKYCQMYGITDYNELRYPPAILGSEYYGSDGEYVQLIKEDDISDFFDNIMWRSSIEYNGENYDIWSVNSFKDILKEIQSGISRHGEDYVYYVYGGIPLSESVNNINNLCIAALICTLVLIVPYMVNENRSGSIDIQLSTKKGRKLYAKKFAAVTAASALSMAFGCVVTGIFTLSLGIGRYYDCRLDSFIESMAGFGRVISLERYYSGITFGTLIFLLLLVTFLFGVVFAGIVYLITSKISNHITAAFASLPIFAVAYLCVRRYSANQIASPWNPLFVKHEVFIVLAVFTGVLAVALLIDYIKKLRREF